MHKHEIVVFNEIIEKIYMEEDYSVMRMSFLKLLGLLVPYDKSTFYLASLQQDKLLTDPVGIGIPQSELERYIDEYEDKDYTRWIFMSGKSMIYRETDLFPEGSREGEPYYREIYIPGKIFYSAQMSIAMNNEFIAVISLYRDKDSGDFSNDDLFILEQLQSHLEHRCYKEWKNQKGGDMKIRNKTHFDTSFFIEKYCLTNREVEVLGLLFGGVSSDKICDVLSISPHTYKKHCINIYKKLGINNRWELINFI